MKNIGLLIIGNEVLSGHIQDLNTQILARFLQTKKANLVKVIIAKDDFEEIGLALKTLMSISDIVITSGGLGPTEDDKTKLAISRLFEKPIEKSIEAEKLTQSHYKRIAKKFKDNHPYIFIIKGSTPLYNKNGLAPGIQLEDNNKILFSFPGVPHEFKGMIEEHLSKNLDDQKETQKKYFRTYGIAEEELFFKRCPTLWQELSNLGEVASLPHFGGVDIVLTPNSNEDYLKAKEIIYNSPIADSVWQDDFISLEETIIMIAKEKGLTISSAESCTGGLIAHRLTSVPGSSAVFKGAIVSYDSQVKINNLQVQKSTIDKYHVVSEEVAKEMAEGGLMSLETDFCISTTGIAGPTGNDHKRPIGRVCIGVATKKINHAVTFDYHGEREQLIKRFATKALFQLYKELSRI